MNCRKVLVTTRWNKFTQEKEQRTKKEKFRATQSNSKISLDNSLT